MSATSLPRYCHLCGRPLGRQHVRFQHGLTVCATCQRTRPRCARCGVPLPPPADHLPAPPGSAHLCATCNREAPRCACCGQTITQHWFSFDDLLPAEASRRYCASCVTSRPRCDICHAPVPQQTAPLADGQYRCAECAREIVLDVPAVHATYVEAIRRARSAAGITLTTVPELHVVGRRAMGRLRERFAPADDTSAAARHVLGLFVHARQGSAVYVEVGLPRPLLLGTLAHELAHAWQSEASGPGSDQLLREGFAEWVAHQVLVDAGQREVAVRATRRDDMYGRGLRHFLTMERSTGRAAVLAAAREASATDSPRR
jgi:hypothetical protein